MSEIDYLRGAKIQPAQITEKTSLIDMVEQTFLAYNAARLKEAAMLFTQKMLAPEVTVGMSLTGALTPAGLGISAIIPLMRAGFIDWIVSTGANLYHDAHFGLGMALHAGTPFVDDRALREAEVIRIYDIFFSYDTLLSTDAFFREVIAAPAFQKTMGSAEFHHLAGKYLAEREKLLGLENQSILAAAHHCGVPIFTSSPGDSSIGMNIAAMALRGNTLRIDPNIDVNETAAIVYNAKSSGGRSAVLILGGGSPKNFLLQTEPQIQEVMGLPEKGHDYFVQITDARPDTGGLSGATPAEAVSWGKVDPEMLPDAVVCYCDTTIALPILTAYALAKHPSRTCKRLFDRREASLKKLETAYSAARAAEKREA